MGLFFLCFGISHISLASHTGTTTKSKATTKYEIAVPILFGVTLPDITPNFGEPRGGGTRTHEGLDIMAPEGTPIVTPVKGTVVRYGTAPNPGKYVYIKGSDGHIYAYMHLDTIAKLKRGQKLVVGDLVGTVGETGNAKGTTPHLHFEIRKGKIIDPYTRIKKEFTFEEKIGYLNGALKDLKKNEADVLVEHMADRYRGFLTLAKAKELSLDKKFVTALQKKEYTAIGSTTVGLMKGSEGAHVEALQNALIEAHMGPFAYRLAQTGATGYFGAVTESALREYQRMNMIDETGVFNVATRNRMVGL